MEVRRERIAGLNARGLDGLARSRVKVRILLLAWSSNLLPNEIRA
jgi:hypothetical protein